MAAATSPSDVGIRRFVALGDSFSAGIGEPDEVPWPIAAAAHLSGDVTVDVLAVEGATSLDVERSQLPRALDLAPDLVSVVCGGNDVLLSIRPDLSELPARLDRLLDAFGDEVTVVCATYPEPGRFLDLGPRTQRRLSDGFAHVNEMVRSAAARTGALCLDWERRSAEGTRAHYARDGVHPSPLGHRDVAQAFTDALMSREETR